MPRHHDESSMSEVLPGIDEGPRRGPDRVDLLAAVLLLVLVPAVFYPLMSHLVRGTESTVPYTDYPAHNNFAAQMRQHRRILLPHPLYHLVLIGVEKVSEAFTGRRLANGVADRAVRAAGHNMQSQTL